ncbi:MULTISPECIES: hypothetical protein [Kitasatospora]|uniref:Uncharacterized protein n=1 Tax=Kitasatospora setae (strain ATCC 33774 / DSM 43861 / JCM 3304 / KCC A-0304 / NBRC 14216 / KM-6054) TaxID=452652 RepID=E4N8G1_KITSK|nr:MULTISPECIES: hypothetical protein [Kitasatospora]BAJ27492.1 hypothetical protein KSE_16670 [Kitasatospora setae KM-6054]
MIRIVVEGMDFTGKTTVCRHLAEYLDQQGTTVVRSTTSLTGGPIPALIEAAYRIPHLPDPVRSALFHLAYLPDLAARPTPPGGHNPAGQQVWLQESYVCRVWAHDLARRQTVLARFAARLAPTLHRRVDLAVLLHSPHEVRHDRYLRTGAPNLRDDRRFGPDADHHRRVEEHLTRLAQGFGYHLIGTSEQPPHESAAQIAALLAELAPRHP